MLFRSAAYYREKGLTMYDGLQSLYREFGHFQERTVSFDFEGLAGQEKMAQVMTEFRQNPVSTVADVAVTRVEDYQAQTATLADGTISKLALPKANVLKYYLADETWIAVRPSGTEPKIKLYFGVVADSEAAGLQKLDRYQAALSPRLQ